MSTVQELFYESFSEFQSKILLDGKFGNKFKGFIFRGESSCRYKLLPSALRPEGRKKLRELVTTIKDESGTRRGLTVDEFDAVKGFYDLANYHGLYVPHVERLLNFFPISIQYGYLSCRKWIPEELYELFALAQHYGIPTRFLDWSFDIHVALYFAVAKVCYEQLCKINNGQSFDKDEFVLWMLNSEYFSYGNGRNLGLKFIVPTYQNNTNLLAQRGILSTVEDSINDDKIDIGDYTPLDKYILDSDLKLYNDMAIIYKIKIPYRECINAFLYLKSVGYTYARIFPGHANIVDDIKERKLWNFIDGDPLSPWMRPKG